MSSSLKRKLCVGHFSVMIFFSILRFDFLAKLGRCVMTGCARRGWQIEMRRSGKGVDGKLQAYKHAPIPLGDIFWVLLPLAAVWFKCWRFWVR